MSRLALILVLGFQSIFYTGCFWRQISREGTAYELFAERSCVRRYRDLYAGSNLNITVLFGYKDTRPQRYVGDRYERSNLVYQLTQKCRSTHDRLCDFKRSEDDMELFYTEIDLPWGASKNVHLRVIDSSVGPDDKSNRSNPYQEWKSGVAKRSFHEALQNSEVVIYNGHSRTGGGPDFFPPKINSSGKVLYSEYREEQQGFKDMLEVITKGALDSKVQVIGLFSCESSQHFSHSLQEKRKDLALISSSSLIYYQDALNNTAETLNALLNLDCAANFKERLNHDDPIKGSQVHGLFAPIQ